MAESLRPDVKHNGCIECKSTEQPILVSTQVPEGKGLGLALCDNCRARRERMQS